VEYANLKKMKEGGFGLLIVHRPRRGGYRRTRGRNSKICGEM
jgi:hypothetical protein